MALNFDVRTRFGMLGFVAFFVAASIAITLVVMSLMFREVPYWSVAPRAALIAGIASSSIMTYVAFKLREIARLNDELSRIVNRDRLTDAATRDYFFTRMEQEPDAYGVSLVIDIDHFKKVNDTHGHQAGDTVIRAVATILASACGENDIVCRYGGEEFVVFLHDTPPEAGEELADRMRKLIERAAITDGDTKIPVTVSIGGSLKDRATDIDEAIRQADEALYVAKNAGRNQTIMTWTDQVWATKIKPIPDLHA